MSQIYLAGALLRFETYIEKSNPPFTAGYAPDSPLNVTLGIEDAAGTELVSFSDMAEIEIGKFYIDIQTSTSWNLAQTFKAVIKTGDTVIGIERFRLST